MMIFDNYKPQQISGSVIVDNLPDTSSKKKKILIISSVLAFIVIIIIIVVIILLNSQKTETYETAFNRYANYILYKKDSADSLEQSYSPYKTYALREITYKDTDFLEKSEELFNNFLSLYYSSDAQTNEINSTINNHQQAFEFLKQYYAMGDFYGEELFNFYIKNGAEKAKTYIDNVYIEMKNSSSSYAREYAEIDIKYSKQLVDYYELENKYGCIVDGKELAECDYDEVLAFYDFDSVIKMQDIFEEAESIIIKDCWHIGRAFNIEVPEVIDEGEVIDEDEVFDDDETFDEEEVFDEEEEYIDDLEYDDIDFNDTGEDELYTGEYYYDEEDGEYYYDDEYYDNYEEYNEDDGSEILFD